MDAKPRLLSCQVLTPAVTLAVCGVLRMERITLPLLGSVVLITAGTGLATVLESSTAGFSWLGFTCFNASVLLEAVRVVCIQSLLGRLRYNEAEVLVYLGSPTAVMLLLASAVWERQGLTKPGGGFALLHGSYGVIILAMLLGATVNLATALAIRASSGLTFKVFGCLKNVFVILYGMSRGDHVSAAQLLGYGVSLSGFAWYTKHKRKQSLQADSIAKKQM